MMLDELGTLEVLLVDSDPGHREEIVRDLCGRGCAVRGVASGSEAMQAIATQHFSVAVIDVDFPDVDGLTLIKKIRSHNVSLPIVVVSRDASVPAVVTAIRAGAADYRVKPLNAADLEQLLRVAEQARQASPEKQRQTPAANSGNVGATLIGQSHEMQRVVHWIKQVAPSGMPVLIEGESGTGKELVAREIHAASGVADQPLVVINCAAVPAALLESELFGHEKGSFTGAVATKRGLFELADGGTLFIDEFGELAGDLQAKLLRVLEDGLIRRVGAVTERQVRVRLVAATNKTLADEVRAGRFRSDLYYRVNVLGIRLPALREHAEDIGPLAQHFLGAGWSLTADAMAVLQRHPWPGNVRQLGNAMERATVLAATSGIVTVDDLPQEIVSTKTAKQIEIGSDIDLQTLNRSHVMNVLKQHRGNKAKTARVLGINRRSLYRLLEKFDLDRPGKMPGADN